MIPNPTQTLSAKPNATSLATAPGAERTRGRLSPAYPTLNTAACCLLQDISGGQPRQIEGVDFDLWGMEIDVDAATSEFMSKSQVRCHPQS